MTDNKAISCLKADKEYLVDNSVCDGEEIDIAIKALEKQEKIKEAFTHYTFRGNEMNVMNDCLRCFLEIKKIMEGRL